MGKFMIISNLVIIFIMAVIFSLLAAWERKATGRLYDKKEEYQKKKDELEKKKENDYIALIERLEKKVSILEEQNAGLRRAAIIAKYGQKRSDLFNDYLLGVGDFAEHGKEKGDTKETGADDKEILVPISELDKIADLLMKSVVYSMEETVETVTTTFGCGLGCSEKIVDFGDKDDDEPDMYDSSDANDESSTDSLEDLFKEFDEDSKAMETPENLEDDPINDFIPM